MTALVVLWLCASAAALLFAYAACRVAERYDAESDRLATLDRVAALDRSRIAREADAATWLD